MVVATMSEEELYNEVYKDLTNVFYYSDKKDNKFRRMVLKSTLFPVRSYCYYTSKLKNKWIVLFEARSKKEIGDDCRVTFVCVYNSSHGMHAVMLSSYNDKRIIITHTPHFFSRFAERCGIELTGIDLIRRYFAINNSYAFDLSKIRDGEIFGSSEEGVALGLISSSNNVFFKTYITYNMLKGNQISTFAETEKMRIEMHYAQ
ncbi:MAG: hypothetical protein RR319_01190 [Bacteroides sp.]